MDVETYRWFLVGWHLVAIAVMVAILQVLRRRLPPY